MEETRFAIALHWGRTNNPDREKVFRLQQFMPEPYRCYYVRDMEDRNCALRFPQSSRQQTFTHNGGPETGGAIRKCCREQPLND